MVNEHNKYFLHTSKGLSSLKMPTFYEVTETGETTSTPVRISHWKPLLVFAFFYYVISCGIERIYQPMVNLYYQFLTASSELFLFNVLGIHLWNLWTPKASSISSSSN